MLPKKRVFETILSGAFPEDAGPRTHRQAPPLTACNIANLQDGCYDRCRFEAGMGTPIHIAAAAPDDYECCARVMASSEPWITLGRDLEGCRAALVRPGTELFVARDLASKDQARPSGFVLLARYGLAGSPYIASIAVAPESRGRGVGSQLLRFAEEHYAGSGHLFLLVSSFNHRAQNLYREHGYEFVGELKDYVVAGQSELILHKRLP
jgi:[ribosomal protein S18]-alanine N-acetyltransferase